MCDSYSGYIVFAIKEKAAASYIKKYLVGESKVETLFFASE